MNNAQKNLLSLGLGALLTLAFAPFFYLPLLCVSLSGLMWLLSDAERKRDAFWLGWCFGFGHFVSSLFWIANSLLVDADQFAWLIPFAVTLIPAAVAVYIGLFALICRSLAVPSSRYMLLMAGIWVIFEALRAYLFTGFPWNLLGYTLMASDALMQFASIVGVYGLSFLAFLLGVAPFLLWRGDICIRVKATLLVIAITGGLWGFGTWKIAGAPESTEKLNLRVVQANIPKKPAPDYEARYNQLQAHIRRTRYVGDVQPDVVVWPEAAINLIVDEPNSSLRNEIAASIPSDAYLFAGAVRPTFARDGLLDEVFNSLLVISPNRLIKGRYDKHHLVPFGEYVPFKDILPFKKITEGMMDISSGEGARVLDINGLKVLPLICYEAIFSRHSMTEATPSILVNVTDDAWFGDTIGPHQHLNMARMRAVEQGVPMARAANTGMSAVIDGYGRIVKRLPLNEPGVINAQVDAEPLPREAMLYRQFGFLAPFIFIFVPVSYALLLIVFARFRNAS